MESIINSMVISLNSIIDPRLLIFLISLMPILELRGGLIAASLLNVDWRLAFLICLAGNMIPIPFILLFIRKVFDLLKKTKMSKFIEKLEGMANKKAESVRKYEIWGLFFFVAIPLPGTGGWTGALIAGLFDMPFKKSVISICLGILVAGIIMATLSYGIVGFFK